MLDAVQYKHCHEICALLKISVITSNTLQQPSSNSGIALLRVEITIQPLIGKWVLGEILVHVQL